MTGKTGKTN